MIDRIKEFFHIKQKEVTKTTEEKIKDLFESLSVDVLRIEIGLDLVEFGDDICNKIWEVREEYKNALGYIVPACRVLENDEIQENCLRVFVREKLVEEIFVVPNKESVLNDLGEILKSVCIDYIDDIFTMDMMENYLDIINKNNNWLVWDCTRFYSVSGLKSILVSLIKEGQSISDICFIFEKINEYIVDNSCYFDSPLRVARGVSKMIKK